MNGECGVCGKAISEVPVAVIDFETTGIYPGADRVVEVCVVRVEPDGQTRVALDTLVNPGRRMAATEIHGITDADVVGAPAFADIAGDVVRAMSGCLVAAYNVYFDLRFLQHELSFAGVGGEPPHVCLMYMRPLLGLGQKCCLGDACKELGIPHENSHSARGDATAEALLLRRYLDAMSHRGIGTFGDLARAGSYKFLDSLNRSPLSSELVSAYPTCQRPKPRGTASPERIPAASTVSTAIVPAAPGALAEYWDALKVAMADMVVTDDELADLGEKKARLKIPDEQIRMLHARFFSGAICHYAADQWLDDKECHALGRVYRALGRLGWVPGQDLPRRDMVDQGASAATPPNSARVSDPGSKASDCLAGKRVVLTGVFQTFSREGAEEAVRAAGGWATSSISRKTDFLVVGTSPGSKADKARELGVEMIDEAEFRKRLGMG